MCTTSLYSAAVIRQSVWASDRVRWTSHVVVWLLSLTPCMSSLILLVRELFKIFRPESNGNFYHFQKVFETILKKFRAQTMATLFEDVDQETGLTRAPLIFDMLPFLDQTPVALSMTKVLFPTYTYGFAEKIQEYYRTLQNGHFMEMLLAMVTLTNGKNSVSI